MKLKYLFCFFAVAFLFPCSVSSALPDDNTTGGVDDFTFDGDEDDWNLDVDDYFENEGVKWLAIPSDSAIVDELSQFVIAFPNATSLRKNADETLLSDLYVRNSRGEIASAANVEDCSGLSYGCAVIVKFDKRIVEEGEYSLIIPANCLLLYKGSGEDSSHVMQQEIVVHYFVSGVSSSVDKVQMGDRTVHDRACFDLLGRSLSVGSKGIVIVNGRKVLK